LFLQFKKTFSIALNIFLFILFFFIISKINTLKRLVGHLRLFSEEEPEKPLPEMESTGEASFSNEELVNAGQVYSFGYGYFGQLGHGDKESTSIPRVISELVEIVKVACGDTHSFAISKNGVCFSWGGNKYGQLGLGDTRDRLKPAQLDSLKGTFIREVSCGSHHTVLLSKKLYIVLDVELLEG